MTPGMTLLGPALGLSAILFSLGVAGVVLRRNAIVLFVCIELMLNAVNLSFVALAQLHGASGQIRRNGLDDDRREPEAWSHERAHGLNLVHDDIEAPREPRRDCERDVA